MITIIKGAKVYSPSYLGKKDILLLNNKIAAIEDTIVCNFSCPLEINEIDGEGKVVVPGFIDTHVHMLGGGGEGGFKTRTPEIMLTDLTKAGITTVVGCLGTDGITRNMTSLLAKARGLDEEGLTTYIYSGSYQIPAKTLTKSVMEDIIVIDKVIGVGEIAISDHRSSQPTLEDFSKLAAEARVGGMLSGKAGILDIHLGDGERGLELLNATIKTTEIPMSQFLPTHINRNGSLFEEGIKYAKAGGYIEFTANEDADFWAEQDGEIRVSQGIKRLLKEGVSDDNFTISSDAQGSLPVFDKDKKFIGLGVGSASSLIKEIKECVLKERIPLEIAIKTITSNPARVLKLQNKGSLKVGFDADLCILDELTLDVDSVIAKGKLMVDKKKPVVLGTFEKSI